MDNSSASHTDIDMAVLPDPPTIEQSSPSSPPILKMRTAIHHTFRNGLIFLKQLFGFGRSSSATLLHHRMEPALHSDSTSLGLAPHPLPSASSDMGKVIVQEATHPEQAPTPEPPSLPAAAPIAVAPVPKNIKARYASLPPGPIAAETLFTHLRAELRTAKPSLSVVKSAVPSLSPGRQPTSSDKKGHILLSPAAQKTDLPALIAVAEQLKRGQDDLQKNLDLLQEKLPTLSPVEREPVLQALGHAFNLWAPNATHAGNTRMSLQMIYDGIMSRSLTNPTLLEVAEEEAELFPSVKIGSLYGKNGAIFCKDMVKKRVSWHS